MEGCAAPTSHAQCPSSGRRDGTIYAQTSAKESILPKLMYPSQSHRACTPRKNKNWFSRDTWRHASSVSPIDFPGPIDFKHMHLQADKHQDDRTDRRAPDTRRTESKTTACPRHYIQYSPGESKARCSKYTPASLGTQRTKKEGRQYSIKFRSYINGHSMCANVTKIFLVCEACKLIYSTMLY
jgi:hypothetical protein